MALHETLVEVLQVSHGLFLGGVVGKIIPLEVRLIALPGCGHDYGINLRGATLYPRDRSMATLRWSARGTLWWS
jgi:hypothetical protein